MNLTKIPLSITTGVNIISVIWTGDFMNEEYKQYDTVTDSEVIEVATKLMDEFDEAFKELAK